MDPPDDASHGSSRRHEIVAVVAGEPPGGAQLADIIPICIPTVEKGALHRSVRKRRFLDFLRGRQSKDWFLRSTLAARHRSRSQVMHRKEEEHHDSSDENAGERRSRFRVPFVRKIRWGKPWSSAARWCRQPANFGIIIWLAFVVAGLLLLLMLMTGMLNGAIPEDGRRKDWTEVINQILNALFTIMCLYEHPTIFHHLVLLLRWRPDGDRHEVRKVYCREGAPEGPHDRAHLLVVVALLHITCLDQYFCCALFWSYSRTDRPSWPLNIGYGLGISFSIIAVIYLAYSPLRLKQPDTTSSSSGEDGGDVEIRAYNRSVVVGSPEWSGGLFDCCDDGTVCAMSATCTFCVFGWNMERLGFGNMWVQAFTFILLCIAPFLVFGITAYNIVDHDIGYILVAVGILLGFCGFLYGSYWRMQMRKRYKLPASGGGGPAWAAVGDCAKWLFCWSCALAQEVRTANFYNIEDDWFVGAPNEEGRAVLMPLPREASATHFRSISCPPEIDAVSPLGVEMADIAMERSDSATYNGYGGGGGRSHAMSPPLPPVIQMHRED